jgi:hypothetical protein
LDAIDGTADIVVKLATSSSHLALNVADIRL